MKNLKKQKGITLIALVVTIIVLLILAGVSLSLVAGGNGIINKAAKAVEVTTESIAVEEVELVIAEANMEYYLDDTVTNETLAEYIAKKFSPYITGSGAQIIFSADGSIQYEGANGDVILLEMQENGKVEVTKKADGTKIQRTVTYNANGGTGSVPAVQNVERNATVNVDFVTLPTREGYQFLGWATSSNAKTPHYSENGTKSFTMGTSNVTLYAVWQDVLIGADNYGDVANYSANGVDDWKVFLNDGTNIYLIASDYVPNSGLNKATNIENGEGDYTIKAIDNRKTLVDWLETASYWSEYAKGMSGATATGGPTALQWIQSWNGKGYMTLYSATKSMSDGLTGIYLGAVENPTGSGYNVSGILGYEDDLYFPHTTSWNLCNSYWLVSPSAYGEVSVLNVYYDGHVASSNGFYTACIGVRPLVRLPVGIETIKNTDGKWMFLQ